LNDELMRPVKEAFVHKPLDPCFGEEGKAGRQPCSKLGVT
jgi:hypothetical protein